MAIALAGRPDRPGQPDRVESLLDVGRQPVQIALKPDGGEIFVSNSSSNSISEVITSTDDVLGAYLMLFPRTRVWTLVSFIPLPLPAWAVLGGWFLLQWAYTSGFAVTSAGSGCMAAIDAERFLEAHHS